MDGQLRREDELRAGGQKHSSQGQEEHRNGTYHCDYQKRSGKCDVCKHMFESNSVLSSHFKRNHAIAGTNIHLKATQTPKLRWFIYLKECSHPEGKYQYVGSTNSITERWANTKSKCLGGKSEGTGLEKHFKEGCSAIQRPGLENLSISLLQHYDTTEELLQSANHKPGPGCICKECDHLKEIESKWIHRLGTLHGMFGLNNRLELHNKSRATY